MRPTWFHHIESEKPVNGNDKSSSDPPAPTSPTSSPEARRRSWSVSQILPKGSPIPAAPAFARAATVSVVPPLFQKAITVNAPQTRQQFLEMQAERLKSEGDITFLLENPEQFAKLKMELRRSGAVTNTLLQHGIHFYCRNHGRADKAT